MSFIMKFKIEFKIIKLSLSAFLSLNQNKAILIILLFSNTLIFIFSTTYNAIDGYFELFRKTVYIFVYSSTKDIFPLII
jgi:hypothetical protein